MKKDNIVVDKRNKMSIYTFSILMFIVFVATFYLVHVFLSDYLFNVMFNNMHTYDIIFEAILAILAFIVLLFWKNS